MSDTNKYYKEKEHKAGWVVMIHLWEVNSGALTWRLKEVKAKPWKYLARKSGPGRGKSKSGGFQEDSKSRGEASDWPKSQANCQATEKATPTYTSSSPQQVEEDSHPPLQSRIMLKPPVTHTVGICSLTIQTHISEQKIRANLDLECPGF